MTTTENKDLVRRFISAINEHDLDALTTFVAKDLVNHSAIPEAQGADGLRRIFEKSFTAIPDQRATVEDLVAEGDRVVCRLTIRGTNTGPFTFVNNPFPPTNRAVQMDHIHVYRIDAGKIAEAWMGRDDFGLLRQLGRKVVAS